MKTLLLSNIIRQNWILFSLSFFYVVSLSSPLSVMFSLSHTHTEYGVALIIKRLVNALSTLMTVTGYCPQAICTLHPFYTHIQTQARVNVTGIEMKECVRLLRQVVNEDVGLFSQGIASPAERHTQWKHSTDGTVDWNALDCVCVEYEGRMWRMCGMECDYFCIFKLSTKSTICFWAHSESCFNGETWTGLVPFQDLQLTLTERQQYTPITFQFCTTFKSKCLMCYLR